eukprot:634018-Prorocentrum_lima.AAC.1
MSEHKLKLLFLQDTKHRQVCKEQRHTYTWFLSEAPLIFTLAQPALFHLELLLRDVIINMSMKLYL